MLSLEVADPSGTTCSEVEEEEDLPFLLPHLHTHLVVDLSDPTNKTTLPVLPFGIAYPFEG